MDSSNYTALANAAWDQAADVHWKTTKNFLKTVKDPAATFLFAPQIAEYQRLGIQGKHVAQLNCNNGKELVSIERLGAAQTTGFDISQKFIQQAVQLSEAAGTHCRFVCSNVYDISAEEFARYDLVVITAGALCFMPDLEKYFAIAQQLLKPGGHISIFESHPVTDMYVLDRDRGDEPLSMVHSYFDRTPVRHETGLDYIHNQPYDSKPIYYFHHTLGDIFNALLTLAFTVEAFEEFGLDPSQALKRVEAQAIKPPLSFILTCQKSS